MYNDDVYGSEFEDFANEEFENGEFGNGEFGSGEENESQDAIGDYLKSIGISDKDNIQWENEDTGEIESVRWDDLSEEDKLGILRNSQELRSKDNYSLTDEESNMVYQMRRLGLSPEEFVQYHQNIGVERAMTNQASYNIDERTDDEIFLMSFLQQVPDATDEEAEEALNNAKVNETLFTKLVEGLRNYYRQIEDSTKSAEEEEMRNQQIYQQQIYEKNVVDAINRFDSIGDLGLDLTNDDKNYLYNFLTGADGAGNNYFDKAINNPDLLVRMAWFALNGESVLDSIQDEAARQIKLTRTKAYNEGYEAAKSGKGKKYDLTRRSKKSNVSQQMPPSMNPKEDISDVFDDAFDGDW